VLRDATCPVWTSTHTERGPFREQATPKQILCAVEADEKAVGLLSWASGYAKEWGAALKVVHAIPQSSPEQEECMHSECVSAIQKLATMAGAEVPVSLERGNPADVISSEASKQNADLIVMGRGAKDSDRLKI